MFENHIGEVSGNTVPLSGNGLSESAPHTEDASLYDARVAGKHAQWLCGCIAIKAKNAPHCTRGMGGGGGGSEELWEGEGRREWGAVERDYGEEWG